MRHSARISRKVTRHSGYKLWTARTSTVGAVTRATATGACGRQRSARLLYFAAVQRSGGGERVCSDALRLLLA